MMAGSRNVSVVVYANQRNWTATQRTELVGGSSVLPGDWRINWPEGEGYPNVWLRLKRSGNTFTTYGSMDGEEWTQIGQSVTPEVPYADTLLVGMRTTPVEVEVPGSTAFARYRDYGNFTVGNASINITRQPASVSVVENNTAGFSVEAEAVGDARLEAEKATNRWVGARQVLRNRRLRYAKLLGLHWHAEYPVDELEPLVVAIANHRRDRSLRDALG